MIVEFVNATSEYLKMVELEKLSNAQYRSLMYMMYCDISERKCTNRGLPDEQMCQIFKVRSDCKQVLKDVVSKM